jgi:hypothetical protein
MPSHRFAIGQSVRLNTRFGLSDKVAPSYRIVAILPARDNSPQYRIRSDEERHERVATEDSIEAIEAPVSAGRAEAG